MVVVELIAGVGPEDRTLFDLDITGRRVVGQRPAEIPDRGGAVDVDAAVESRRSSVVADPQLEE